MEDRRKALVDFPCSVFHDADKTPTTDINSVVVPFPTVYGAGWKPVALYVKEEPESTRPTTKGSLVNDAKCINVVIQKGRSSVDGSKIQVWIDGFLASPVNMDDEEEDEIYELPAFSKVFSTVLNNNERVSCVDPVALSFLVERTVRPPEIVEIRSQQLYVVGSKQYFRRHTVQVNEGLSETELRSSQAEGIQSHATIFPYPCCTPRDPFVVINDVRARRDQNARKLKKLLEWLTSAIVAYLLVGGVLSLAGYTVSGTYLGQLVAGISLHLRSEGGITRAWTFLRNQVAGDGISQIQGLFMDPRRLPGAIVEFSRTLFSRIVTLAALPPVRKVEFTLVQLASALDRISEGNAALDDQTRVLVDWLLEHGSTSDDDGNWTSFLKFVEEMKNRVDWLTRKFEFSPFPRSGDLDMEGCNVDKLNLNVVEHRIVVTVTDTQTCDTKAKRITFKAQETAAFRAGLLQSSLHEDTSDLVKALNTFDTRMRNDQFDTKAFESAFDLNPGLVENIRINGLTGTGRTLASFAKQMTSLASMTRNALQRGVLRLRTSTLESTELTNLRNTSMSRHRFQTTDTSKTPAGAIVRRLPQPMHVKSVGRPYTKVPVFGGEFMVNFNDSIDDNTPNPTQVTASFGSIEVIGTMKPVYVAGRLHSQRAYRAVLSLKKTFECGPLKLSVLQTYEDKDGLNRWITWLQTNADACYQQPVYFETLRKKMGSSPLAMCASIPADVVDKIIDDERCRGAEQTRRIEWVSRDGEKSGFASLVEGPVTSSAMAAAFAASCAWSDLVVDAQLDRSELSVQTALMRSVTSLIEERSLAMLSLANVLIQKGIRPYDDDLVFYALPGGCELFRFLHRLGALQRRVWDDSNSAPRQLAVSCREFVSNATFEDKYSTWTMIDAISFPQTVDAFVDHGIAVFKKIKNAKDLKTRIPSMANFVMSEAEIQIQSQARASWSRRLEVLGAIESVSSFVLGATRTLPPNVRESVTFDVVSTVIYSRPSLLLSEELQGQNTQHQYASNELVDELRNGRRVNKVTLPTPRLLLNEIIEALCTRVKRYATSPVANNEGCDVPRQDEEPLKLLVPFAAGDNLINPFRFPPPVFLRFDTTPLSVSALGHGVYALLDSAEAIDYTNPNIISLGRISDRSRTMRYENNAAGDPLGIHISREGSSEVLATVIMSQVVGDVTPSNYRIRGFREDEYTPESLLRKVVQETSPMANPLETASEVIWNAERIYQAALSLVGLSKDTRHEVERVVVVEQPVGWVLSPTERLRRFNSLELLEAKIRQHDRRKRDIVARLFDTLWSSVLEMRYDTATQVRVEADSTDAVVALQVVDTAAALIDQFSNLLTNVSTGAEGDLEPPRQGFVGGNLLPPEPEDKTLPTPADGSIDTPRQGVVGGNLLPSEPEDKTLPTPADGSIDAPIQGFVGGNVVPPETTLLSPGQMARIEERPADAYLADTEDINEFFSERNRDTIKDIIVSRFRRFLQPSGVASNIPSNSGAGSSSSSVAPGSSVSIDTGGVYATKRASDMYSDDGGENAIKRSKERLAKAFDGAVVFADNWTQHKIDLLQDLQLQEVEFDEWVTKVMVRVNQINDLACWRFCIAMTLSQTFLTQTLGSYGAPVLASKPPPPMMGSAKLRPSPNLSNISYVFENCLKDAVAQCEADGFQWLTVGEFVRILVQRGYEEGNNTQYYDSPTPTSVPASPVPASVPAAAVPASPGPASPVPASPGPASPGPASPGPSSVSETVPGEVPSAVQAQVTNTSKVVFPVVPWKQAVIRAFTLVPKVSLDGSSVSTWTTLTTPVLGLDRMTSALIASRPVIVPLRPKDVSLAQLGTTILNAFRTDPFRTFSLSNQAFPTAMLQTWSPLRMGTRFLVRDVFQSLLAAQYVDIMSSTDLDVLRWLPRAFVSIRRSGTIRAIAEAVDRYTTGTIDDVVKDCSIFEHDPLQFALCQLLSSSALGDKSDRTGNGFFRSRNATELRFKLSDFKTLIDEYGLNEVQKNLDFLFCLVDAYDTTGAQWNRDDSTGYFFRSLPTEEERVSMTYAVQVAIRSVTETSLISGIPPQFVFSFMCMALFGVGILFTMNGNDIVATGNALVNTRAPNDERIEQTVERVSEIFVELFTRIVPLEQENMPFFQDRVRFVLSGTLNAFGLQGRIETGTPGNTGGDAGDTQIHIIDDGGWSDWIAKGVIDGSISIIEYWVLRGWQGG